MQIVVCDAVNCDLFKKNKLNPSAALQPKNNDMPSHSTVAQSVAKFHIGKYFMNVKKNTRTFISTALIVAAALCISVSGRAQAQQSAPEEFSTREMWSHRTGVWQMIHLEHPPGHEVYVTLKVIVAPLGKVESATAISGPKEFYAQAETLELKREFKPFIKNGHSVRASIEDYISILPPVQWAAKKVPFPGIKDWNSLRIKLQRTVCYGTCPAYSIEIRGDGSVTYFGSSFTLITGTHHEQIPKNVVVDLVNQFRAADYFSLKDRYHWNVTDNPTYTTSIEFDGHKKEVIDYVGLEDGMPEVVEALEKSIDDAVGVEKWLKQTGHKWLSPLQENRKFNA
jgi:Domain of unknown function (DUF6438)